MYSMMANENAESAEEGMVQWVTQNPNRRKYRWAYRFVNKESDKEVRSDRRTADIDLFECNRLCVSSM